ncbi:GNAT family N-acetyltransferase [Actinoplanes sp. Pm04-4]|uniref:GNAT family N-acetyltransferase n=1 Tax=Paractinoplanes pyxinae TaxID=2997416 RepID=A0ABT4B0Y6_9ACTN|nr:GNAT family N-acetyltransferase [Actinoplanes pyxinae]MCY1140141.1 GNAT family N-acetyltransferase [Actinoplanes pyxinae]
MSDDLLVEHARRLWAGLAGAPVEFGADGLEVVVSSSSRLCPPGWVGIVRVSEGVIATAPDERSADVVRRGLGGLGAAALTDVDVVRGRLPVEDVLGPATLAYCDADGFRAGADECRAAADGVRAGADDGVERVAVGELGSLIGRVSDDERGEAGLEDIDSAAFVLRSAGEIVAASGYEVWPTGTAHLSVLTDPRHRGRGLARSVASAAVRDALRAGLVPQWRARPEPSRRLARALGFRELGAQLSIRLHTTPS